ncbi:MAG: phosphoribosyltransferase family protein [Ramlibacter sp.]
MIRLFNDRIAAGSALASRLLGYAGRDDVVVLGLPRGGVPVAWEVARVLGCPLELLLVRKLGVPDRGAGVGGAIAGGGAMQVDPQVVANERVSPQQLDRIVATESLDLIRRHALYCGNRELVSLEGRTVIVVDDGVVTGETMRAALKALRSAKPAWIVVAVPVAPPEAQDLIGTAADEFVCLANPADFQSVGEYYREFGQTSDEEIRRLVARAAPEARD